MFDNYYSLDHGIPFLNNCNYYISV